MQLLGDGNRLYNEEAAFDFNDWMAEELPFDI